MIGEHLASDVSLEACFLTEAGFLIGVLFGGGKYRPKRNLGFRG